MVDNGAFARPPAAVFPQSNVPGRTSGNQGRGDLVARALPYGVAHRCGMGR